MKKDSHPKEAAASQEPRRKLSEAEMLLDISRTIAAFETLDEILKTLVEITAHELKADRGTIFLNDPETGELYSRVAQGNIQREIRILNNSGVAGHVFTTGEGVIVHDAYRDPRFNRNIDESTGYTTKAILCVPIRTIKGEIIGVAQALNRRKGRFTKADQKLLESMTTQAAIAMQSTQYVERMKQFRRKEMEFFDIVSDITAEIDLGALLQKVMSEATRMLNAERATALSQRRKDKRAFLQGGVGIAGSGDPVAELPRDCRGSLHLPADDQHPLRLRRSSLQSRLRQEDRIFHPLDPLRTRHQQGWEDHRGYPGLEQAERPIHTRGRIAAEGVHRPGLHRARKCQALRRRPEHEELQREHAGEHVQRCNHLE